jgi:carbon-monoxide dehydrogenase large subunit
MTTYVGRPLKRFEDPRLVTGQGSFVDDLRLPGMLHAVVLRSPHAHARLLSLDAAPARALPGVVAVLTASDIAGAVRDIPPRPTRELEGRQVPEHPVLARDKVCYVGQPVAVVVAGSLPRQSALSCYGWSMSPYRPHNPVAAAQDSATPLHGRSAPSVACVSRWDG